MGNIKLVLNNIKISVFISSYNFLVVIIRLPLINYVSNSIIFTGDTINSKCLGLLKSINKDSFLFVDTSTYYNHSFSICQYSAYILTYDCFSEKYL